jgi:RND family efflux transporter MFP subunit
VKRFLSSVLRVRFLRFPEAFVILILSTGCAEKNAFVAPPPPQVEVMTPAVGPVLVYLESPARTTSFARAEVRARVKGFLKETHFSPGRFVKAGDALFTIEPEQFEAAVASAAGQVERAKADLGIAKTNLEKRTEASKTGAISQIDVAAADAEAKAAAASVKIAEAALRDAERDLGYTKITSPIDGLVSKAEIDQGNLVGADGATLLTTVVHDDPIYVEFEANERDILSKLSNRPSADSPDFSDLFRAVKVRLTLSDGTVYPVEGSLDYLDNAVDPETGTMRVRAKFPNPDGALASGLFVRVGMPMTKGSETEAPAIRVPAEVVQRDLGGTYVLVVGPENKVMRRPVVSTGFREGSDLILSSGLTAEDRLIVSNLQKARPGITVVPMPKGAAAPSAAPAVPPAASPPAESTPPAAEPAPKKEG